MKYIYAVIVIIALWLIAINSPHFFINKTYSCHSLVFHYSKDRNFEKLCNTFSEVSDKTGIVDSNDTLDFYITDSNIIYYIFSYFSRSDFYVNFINDYVLLSPLNDDNSDFLMDEDLNFREELSKAIVSLKLLKSHTKLEYLGINSWKIKGYSKYVLSEVQEFSEQDMCDKKSAGKKYDEYENMVVTKFIFDEKRYNYSQFFDDSISYDVYLREARNRYCH
jgi:hypothetical protein